MHLAQGKRVLYTFLDEGFDRDWGQAARLLKDTGRLADNGDGGYRLDLSAGETGHLDLGAGIFRVRIGGRGFTCLRVIGLRAAANKASLERGILSESFYTRGGQLVLFRRYNGRLWQVGQGKAAPYGRRAWDERFPEHARLVINGAVFVHWYDCLTDASLHVAPGAQRRRVSRLPRREEMRLRTAALPAAPSAVGARTPNAELGTALGLTNALCDRTVLARKRDAYATGAGETPTVRNCQ